MIIEVVDDVDRIILTTINMTITQFADELWPILLATK